MEQLQSSVAVIRRELQNLRRQMKQLEHMVKSEIQTIKTKLLPSPVHEKSAVKFLPVKKSPQPCNITSLLSKAAIGRVRTCFREKNGTPRQPGLVSSARGVIQVEGGGFTNPHHSLEGLEEYSHIWLIFVFHLNENDACSVRAKVKPPRLAGEKRGVFATRSPHRPCPIGLSLVKIDAIEGNSLHVSGVDLVDGTPILDIKPYIPSYDNPVRQFNIYKDFEKMLPSLESEDSLVKVAPWLETPPSSLLDVEFTKTAKHQLSLFQHNPRLAIPTLSESNRERISTGGTTIGNDPEERNNDDGCVDDDESIGKESPSPQPRSLQLFSSVSEAREAIVEVLQQDPRSVYRREKCSCELYKFSIDNLNITCEFTEQKVRVIDIESKEKWTYYKQTY